jgi:2-keto-4-pentenoate hydratase/2-oxohepta-3-ene-1,7-dioic acid hydratase in catechol pathway
MRLVSYGPAGQERLGALTGDGKYILDLNRADGRIPSTMVDFLRGDFQVRARELLVDTQKTAPSALVERAGVRLGAPVPRPGLIVCVGLNYKDHADEQGDPYPPAPLLFCKAPGAACGPEDEIVYPDGVTKLDYEVELGVVIGRTAKKVSAAKAADVIAGYCVFNDVSARCAQFGDKQWFRGKSFDTFAPFGPALVTADEAGAPRNWRLRSWVNGEPRQDSNTERMIHDVGRIIEHASRGITLQPGDVVATGTPSGVGVFMKPPRLLLRGDVVEMEVEGLGRLKNRVV